MDWEYFGGRCYFFHKDPYTCAGFLVAQQICELKNSNLASVHSEAENEFLKQRLTLYSDKKSAWIGLNDIDHVSYNACMDRMWWIETNTIVK